MKRLCLLVFIYTISLGGFSLNLDFCLRRVKSPVVVQNNIAIFTSQGLPLTYTWKHFPDGEIYIRLDNPAQIRGQKITLQFIPQVREDFLMLLFLTSIIREYGPDEIKVNFESWTPENLAEEVVLSALANFVDEIKLPSQAEFYFYTRSIIPPVSKFDRILYLKPRFRKYAQRLGKDFDADVQEVNIFSDKLHWNLELPGDIKGKDILILHSTQSSDDILSLISTLYSLRKSGARSITLVNTYQGYARQDKIFNPGEGTTAYALLKVLNSLSDYNLTVNVHFGEKTGVARLKDEAVYNINGFKYLAEGIFNQILEDYSPQELNGKTLVLLAPDDGSFNYVQEVRDEVRDYLGIKEINMQVLCGYLNKTRASPERVVMQNGILSAEGKEIKPPEDAFFIILDDETSTGMTVKVATYHLVNNLNYNWWHIYAGIVHGKFIGGMRKFFAEGSDNMPPRFIASLDTLNVPERIQRISVYPLLKESLEKFLQGNYIPVP